MTGTHVVIDAWNVVGSRPDGWWRDRRGALERLLEGARRLAAEDAAAVTVVADGRPFAGLAEGAYGDVELRYAPGGPNAADDVIVELVCEATSRGDEEQGHRLTVATSDKGLRRRLDPYGVEVMPAPAARNRLDALTGEDEGRDEE